LASRVRETRHRELAFWDLGDIASDAYLLVWHDELMGKNYFEMIIDKEKIEWYCINISG